MKVLCESSRVLSSVLCIWMVIGCSGIADEPVPTARSKEELELLLKRVGGKLSVQRGEDGKTELCVDLQKLTIGDDVFRAFLEFPIAELNLSEARLSDRRLIYLKNMGQLTRIDLSCTSLTDEQFKEIAKVKGLQQLYLFDVKISGNALRHLGTLKLLRTIWLDGRTVNDETIRALASCPNLKILILSNTAVTREAVTFLRKSRNDLVVVRR